jgi:hypothetical protein
VDIKLFKQQRVMESETPTSINLSKMQGEFQREEEKLTFDDTKRRSRDVSTKSSANNASSSPPTKSNQKKPSPKTGGLSTKLPNDKEMMCFGCNMKGHRL